MAIGNIPSQAQLNSQIAQIAGTFVSNAIAAQKLAAYANGLGTAGLQALGFTSGDATTFIAQADYLSTVAGVIQGTATQGTDFNFVGAWVTVTGPN